MINAVRAMGLLICFLGISISSMCMEDQSEHHDLPFLLFKAIKEDKYEAACSVIDAYRFQLKLEGQSINLNELKDSDGNPPLHAAALSGNADLIRLLLRHGALVDQENGNHRTALQLFNEYVEERIRLSKQDKNLEKKIIPIDEIRHMLNRGTESPYYNKELALILAELLQSPRDHQENKLALLRVLVEQGMLKENPRARRKLEFDESQQSLEELQDSPGPVVVRDELEENAAGQVDHSALLNALDSLKGILEGMLEENPRAGESQHSLEEVQDSPGAVVVRDGSDDEYSLASNEEWVSDNAEGKLDLLHEGCQLALERRQLIFLKRMERVIERFFESLASKDLIAQGHQMLKELLKELKRLHFEIASFHLQNPHTLINHSLLRHLLQARYDQRAVPIVRPPKTMIFHGGSALSSLLFLLISGFCSEDISFSRQGLPAVIIYGLIFLAMRYYEPSLRVQEHNGPRDWLDPLIREVIKAIKDEKSIIDEASKSYILELCAQNPVPSLIAELFSELCEQVGQVSEGQAGSEPHTPLL